LNRAMKKPADAEAVMEKLRSAGIEYGDMVRVRNGEKTSVGILLPHDAFSRQDVVVLKLRSGYNIGVKCTPETEVELVEKRHETGHRPASAHAREAKGKSGRKVAFIGTGGTIASFVDYRTGGVFPAYDADGIVSLVPEISSICRLEGETLFSQMSENFGYTQWKALAEEVASRLNAGYRGVLIAHGTDTMAYTAAALSFMLKNITGPVVLVGAQRSPDRPSFDGYLNLICSARVAAESDLGEVVVVMHSSSSDRECTVHRGTKVRKMHSSRRDAFRSVNSEPIAFVDGGIRYVSGYRHASEGRVEADTRMAGGVSLIQFYPDLDGDEFMRITEGRRGVVIAGTGLGHVSSEVVECIRKRVSEGMPVVATTQCLYGTVDLKVYSTGRDMLKAGVIRGFDMLPEVAYVKLRWVLAHHRKMEEIRRVMESNISGEISARREGVEELV
jgi:glutamyl-tRNA(Gln) amidotransferase subunit D